MYVCGCCSVVKAYPTLCNPMDCVAWQASQSMELSRQEYWNGLPFLSPGDLHDPETKPVYPVWQADSLQLSHLGSPYMCGRKNHFRLICMVGKTILGLYSIQRVSYSKSRKETLTRSNLQVLFYKRLFWMCHTGSSRVEIIYPSWAEEPGGPQFTGLHRFRHDWATWLSLVCIMNSVVVFIC